MWRLTDGHGSFPDMTTSRTRFNNLAFNRQQQSEYRVSMVFQIEKGCRNNSTLTHTVRRYADSGCWGSGQNVQTTVCALLSDHTLCAFATIAQAPRFTARDGRERETHTYSTTMLWQHFFAQCFWKYTNTSFIYLSLVFYRDIATWLRCSPFGDRRSAHTVLCGQCAVSR